MYHAAFLDGQVVARAENPRALEFAIRVVQHAKKDRRPVKRGNDRIRGATDHEVATELGAVRFRDEDHAKLALTMRHDMRQHLQIHFARWERWDRNLRSATVGATPAV